MVVLARSAVAGALLASVSVASPVAKELSKKDVDTRYPYNGPTVVIADWVDQTVNGNGKGFYRVSEPPAVTPANANPTNNINVINMAFVPGGMNIHFQTTYGLGQAPKLVYGSTPSDLSMTATGASSTYNREPPCSSYAKATECSQFFHNIQITNLAGGQTYYYQIQAANGTTQSDVLSFVTAPTAGTSGEFSAILLNDMGYTNAQGTHRKMLNMIEEEGIAFALHGGDISYADDFTYGLFPCIEDYHCYNGLNSTKFPEGYEDPVYNEPLPAGEIPDYGGPFGGDSSTIYESNWDIWQRWMSDITTKIPYHTNPGNHEASCTEYDVDHILANYLGHNITNDSDNSGTYDYDLSYWDCPPTQRNFTTYQYRFRMPGNESHGKGNMWHSFDYGLAHFISFDGETDYAHSPESNFLTDTNGRNATPIPAETFANDAGPFGYIEGWGNNTFNNTAYEQYQWMKADLAAVNRTKTPWIIASSHRPMYSTAVASYQVAMRNAFEALFLEYGVDLYVSGHVHWYERLWPLGANGTIDTASIVNNNTYKTNPGKSLTHIVNGMAGNIETHTELGKLQILNITNVLNNKQFGFSKLTIHNASVLTTEYIQGNVSTPGDTFTLIKNAPASGINSQTTTVYVASTPPATGTASVTVHPTAQESNVSSSTAAAVSGAASATSGVASGSQSGSSHATTAASTTASTAASSGSQSGSAHSTTAASATATSAGSPATQSVASHSSSQASSLASSIASSGSQSAPAQSAPAQPAPAGYAAPSGWGFHHGQGPPGQGPPGQGPPSHGPPGQGPPSWGPSNWGSSREW